MPVNYKTIGKNIQIRRKRLHITQQKMADDLYLSTSLISKLERGVKAVSLDTLSSIAEYLNTTIAILLSAPTDNSEHANLIMTEINAMLENLEERDLFLVGQLLRTYCDNIKALSKKESENEKRPEET